MRRAWWSHRGEGVKTEAQEGGGCWRTHTGAPEDRQLGKRPQTHAQGAFAFQDGKLCWQRKRHRAEQRTTSSCKTNSAKNQSRGPNTSAPSRGTASGVNSPPANEGDARDAGPIPGSGRCPGGGNGNPRQCSCLGNPMDRGAWWATVLGVSKIYTRLSN